MGIGKVIKRFFGFGGGIGYTGPGGGRTMFGNATTTSGVPINEESAMTIPAFFHGIRLYGQVLGSLDWDLIQIDEKGNRNVARTHPVHRLLHDDPNEFQVASSFRETLIGHSIVWGNGFAFIERNGNQRPTALLPLLPDRTWVTRNGGVLKFITMVNGLQQELDPSQVLHLPSFSTNGLTGIPLVKKMAETLGLTKAEEEYASAYFGNGGNFGTVYEIPGRLDDAAMKNFRDSTNAATTGLGNAFRNIYLEEGITANRSEVDAEKTQIINARQFQLGDLARCVGLAPHLLYDLSRSTNNNIEQQGIEAVTYSFRPIANKLNQEATRKLLYESEKGIFEPRLDLKPLMVGDSKSQAETDQIRFNSAAMTPNEIRAKDGRNSIPGGDQLFLNTTILPLNLIIEQALAQIEAAKTAAVISVAQGGTTDPDLIAQAAAALKAGIDNAPADPNDAPSPQGGDLIDLGPTVPADEVTNVNTIGAPLRSAQAARDTATDLTDRPVAVDAAQVAIRALTPMVRATFASLLRRESKALRAAATKHTEPADLTRWADGFTTDTRRVVAEALTPVGEALAGVGVTIDPAAITDAWAQRTAADVAALAAGKLADREANTDLLVEGWHGRVDEMTKTVLGERL